MDQFHAPAPQTQDGMTAPAPKTAPKPPVKPKVQPADPTTLAGQDEESVIRLLGPPATTQFKGTAKVLVWRSDLCAFDVLMFQDVKSGTWRTLSWLVEDGSATLSATGCFGSIKGSR